MKTGVEILSDVKRIVSESSTGDVIQNVASYVIRTRNEAFQQRPPEPPQSWATPIALALCVFALLSAFKFEHKAGHMGSAVVMATLATLTLCTLLWRRR